VARQKRNFVAEEGSSFLVRSECFDSSNCFEYEKTASLELSATRRLLPERSILLQGTLFEDVQPAGLSPDVVLSYLHPLVFIILPSWVLSANFIFFAVIAHVDK
jgi:hypothetical protein